MPPLRLLAGDELVSVAISWFVEICVGVNKVTTNFLAFQTSEYVVSVGNALCE